MLRKLGLLAVVVACSGLAQTASAQNAVTGSVGSAPQQKGAELKSLKDKSSYLLGRQAAVRYRDLQVQGHLDVDKFLAGVRAELMGEKNPIDRQEFGAVMTAFQKKLQEEFKALAANNLKEGADFLAKNKVKPGVKTMDNGIQYIVLKDGTGAIPKETDSVKVHYVGTFIDGKEFDSSVRRGEPITFPLQGVIRGWTKTVSRMKVGSKWRVFIPGNLAYGPQGRGEIGPNKLLIFEIELLGIEAPKANAAGGGR